jgi:hypothetical protein
MWCDLDCVCTDVAQRARGSFLMSRCSVREVTPTQQKYAARDESNGYAEPPTMARKKVCTHVNREECWKEMTLFGAL